jgi:hypothetical protein
MTSRSRASGRSPQIRLERGARLAVAVQAIEQQAAIAQLGRIVRVQEQQPLHRRERALVVAGLQARHLQVEQQPRDHVALAERADHARVVRHGAAGRELDHPPAIFLVNRPPWS